MVSAWVTLVLLGLLGSAGHCVGMCGPVTLLLTRPARTSGTVSLRRWLILLHAGRVVTYALLGGLAAALGQALSRAAPGLRYVQGGIALLVAAVLLYMALAAAGRVPPVEALFAGVATRWGRVVQGLTVGRAKVRPVHAALLGLVWGFLPCGLVYSAVLIAATTAHPLAGMAGMVLFGLGTVPAMAGLGWATAQGRLAFRDSLRYVAASLIFLFSVQMALRGLAAWGWVAHVRVGGVMLW